jgi:NAD(P)-dependent dehydrogenase (short-subunit alcohol dehydrogenase family)
MVAGDSLAGTKVVVIGGSAGIGFSVAEAAIAEGAGVLVASSNSDRVEAARNQLGGQVEGGTVDVTSDNDVVRFFAEAGRFDHLVYTAGDWAPPVDYWDLEAAARIFSVRFWGALRAIKHSRASLSTGGSITLTNGVAAHRPRKGAAMNTAAAGAIEHLVTGLAIDLAPLRVNAVCPGVVLTGVWANLPEGAAERMTSRQPVPRGASPAEIAEAYLYLMRGTYTTGQVLRVDGGYLLV